MRLIPRTLLFFSAVAWSTSLTAEPLVIDLTNPFAPAAAAAYGPVTTQNPQGGELTMDQRSVFLNGQPWIPILGEFHFSRYPRAEWRDELLKMKAGGINVVSTYVFWIHHEENRGTFTRSPAGRAGCRRANLSRFSAVIWTADGAAGATTIARNT